MATYFYLKKIEQKQSYETAMGEMFKTIPKNDGIKLTSSEKKSKINYRYWGWMVFG